MSSQTSNSKTKIFYTIDDEACSHARLINSSLSMQQTLQLIRDKINNQNLQYVYINGSIIDELDNQISDWNEPNAIFNFRQSKINNPSRPQNSNSSSNTYNFTVFTTTTWDSLTKGETFTLKKNMNHDEFENLIRDHCSINSHIPISQMKLLIFLPGGVEFTDSTLKDYVDVAKPEKLHIYVIITKGVSLSLLTKEIVEICDVRGEMSTLFSPIIDSSEKGKQLFACLLSSIFHQTTGRKELLKSLSKITAFPPLIASLQALIDRKTITGKDLLMITAPMFTIFKYFINDYTADANILEFCTKLCNLISQIDDSDEIPLESHSINSVKSACIKQYMQNKNLSTITFWRPDFEKKAFSKKDASPFTPNQLQNPWDEKQHFKPIKPLTLQNVHVSSIVYGPSDTFRVFVMDSTDSKEKEASSKVDLIDPETGQTTHEDIEEFAKDVKEKDKEGEKVELIDAENINQITMVLVDQSGSMKDKFSNNSDVSRDSLAKQFLTTWASKSFGYRISSLQGLISFDTDVTVKLELSPLIPDFEKSVMDTEPYGWTELWKAIKLAAEKLVAKKNEQTAQNPKFKNATLRILVLTDGKDTSDTNPIDLLPFLIENNIIVDVVIVSLTASCSDACTLAHLTGGLAFRPSTLEEGIALFEKEALLSISYREKPQPFKDTITQAVFDNHKSNLSYDKEPKNKFIMQAQARQPLLTPRAAVKGLDGTSLNRLRRIGKELRIAYRWEDNDVKVYPVENLVDRWRIYIKGPESTLYENKWWYLYATFPDNYPYSPPIFRFITVPYHINISDEGRICMNTIGSDYSSSMNVMELIANIKALLMLPNYEDPIDIAKFTLYKKSDDHHEFSQKIKDSTQKAQNDINCYLSNTIISDDANYEVPEERYIPAQNRCPITRKPLDPANTVVASSGIRYDRDALRRLLLSSSQPKCVITHKILTDDPNLL